MLLIATAMKISVQTRPYPLSTFKLYFSLLVKKKYLGYWWGWAGL
jgi:hypothetical protein